MIRALAAALLLWGIPHRAMPPVAQSGDDFADRLAALDRCRQGYADLATADLTTGQPKAGSNVVRACADLYREPACAEAMRKTTNEFTDYPDAIARACRAAYCPRLPAPRPKLCEAATLPPRHELLESWNELQRTILGFELGIDPAVLAPLFKTVKATVIDRPPAPVRPPSRPVFIKVIPESHGDVRVWFGNVRSIVVHADVRDDDPAVAALIHQARLTVPAGTEPEVILKGDTKILTGPIAIALMKSFNKEGFGRVALMTQPPAAR